MHLAKNPSKNQELGKHWEIQSFIHTISAYRGCGKKKRSRGNDLGSRLPGWLAPCLLWGPGRVRKPPEACTAHLKSEYNDGNRHLNCITSIRCDTQNAHSMSSNHVDGSPTWADCFLTYSPLFQDPARASAFIWCPINDCRGLPGSSAVKDPPAKRETQVRSLGREDLLEKRMATHSSLLAWEIPQTVEPGGYSPWGRKRIRHDLATEHKNKVTVEEMRRQQAGLGKELLGTWPRLPRHMESTCETLRLLSRDSSVNVNTQLSFAGQTSVSPTEYFKSTHFFSLKQICCKWDDQIHIMNQEALP